MVRTDLTADPPLTDVEARYGQCRQQVYIGIICIYTGSEKHIYIVCRWQMTPPEKYIN